MVKEVHQCSSCGGFCKKSGCERANVDSTPKQEPIYTREQEIAIREANQLRASDEYFDARHKRLDTVDNRRVFDAGFCRGWDKRGEA